MTYEEYLKQQNKTTDAGSANLGEATQNAQLKQESNTVTQAQNALQSQLQGSAQGFTSKYQPQLEELYNKVMNREKFSYDVNSDPLYQQYKNQYAQMGQLAMQDTVGNASALTGGYGNSYAATAGNQAYQGYLQQLNGIVPQLYESAYGRYTQEGNDLQNLLGVTSDLYNNELANYWKGQEFDFNKEQAERDWQQAQHNMQIAQGNLDLNKTQAERDYELALQQMGLSQSQFDFNKTQAEREYEMALKELEMNQGKYGITERSAAFEQAVAMMQMGMTPSSELLALAGLTPEQAAEYVKQFQKSTTTYTTPKKTEGSNNTVNLQGKEYKMDDLGIDIIGREFNQLGNTAENYNATVIDMEAEAAKAEEEAARAHGMTVEKYRDYLKGVENLRNWKKSDSSSANVKDTIDGFRQDLDGLTAEDYLEEENRKKWQ